jgi:hypothetical protein
VFVVMIAALILSRAASVLASENPIGIAPQQEITFTAPTIVGGNLLPARNCKVLHEMQGTTHIMIFKQRGGKTEAKAKGNLVPLDAKATRTRAALHEKRKEPARIGRNDLPRRHHQARSGALAFRLQHTSSGGPMAAFSLRSPTLTVSE